LGFSLTVEPTGLEVAAPLVEMTEMGPIARAQAAGVKCSAAADMLCLIGNRSRFRMSCMTATIGPCWVSADFYDLWHEMDAEQQEQEFGVSNDEY
jgi:hypothetical protein